MSGHTEIGRIVLSPGHNFHAEELGDLVRDEFGLTRKSPGNPARVMLDAGAPNPNNP